MKIEIPGVDVAKGLELYDDDEDIYLVVLRSYASNTPAVLDKLRNLSAETLPDYAAAIHGIKGTSATIGAEDLRKTAMKLEVMAQTGDLPGLLARNGAFLEQANTLVGEIKKWLEENDVQS